MTEQEARDWIERHFGATVGARLARFADRVRSESARQNLVARSTLDHIWVRHMLDSAQLVLLAPAEAKTWLDIGTGAGFPGLVIALLGRHDVTLVEPRRRRIDFLRDCLEGVSARLVQSQVETFAGAPQDVLSARAVAPVTALFAASGHLRGPNTRYLLPRGRSARDELETIRQQWHGVFHVEQSLTDPASGILLADQVAPR